MIKHVTKTTKEYMYDEQGRISKEVVTEEYSEQEINEKEDKPFYSPVKKALGVPTISGVMTGTFQTKEGLTTTIQNIANKANKTEDELVKEVTDAINRHMNY